MNPKKFYIASKLENFENVQRLNKELQALGHTITYDWTKHGPVYGSGIVRVREVAQAEAKGVAEADFVVVLWPGGRGTHVELGMAIAMNKTIFIVSDVVGHHVSSTETCAFYHSPQVMMCSDIQDVLAMVQAQYPPELAPEVGISNDCCARTDGGIAVPTYQMSLGLQIELLANFIQKEMGGPSIEGGAVDNAIYIMRGYRDAGQDVKGLPEKMPTKMPDKWVVVGDVVRLNSGGPRMTVISENTNLLAVTYHGEKGIENMDLPRECVCKVRE